MVNSEINVLINTIVNSKNMKAFGKDLEKIGKNRLKGPQQFFKDVSKTTQIQNLTDKFKDLGLQYNTQGQLIDTVNKKTLNYGQAVKLASDRQIEFTKQQKNTQAAVLKTKNSIFSFSRAMGGLSLLFAGQQVGRALQRLMVTTVGVFREITKSQTEAGMAMTALSANVQFLKFSLGNAISTAIAPMVPKLIEIITAISEWISLHPKLFTYTTLFTLIGSKIAAVAGQIILLIAGVKALAGFNVVNGVTGSSLTTLGKKFSSVKKNNIMPFNSLLSAMAITGFSIKAVIDIEKFLSGSKNLEETISSLSTSLLGIGIFSGNAWLITIGVILKIISGADKLRSFGERVISFGQNLAKMSAEQDGATAIATGPLLAGASAISLIGGAAITGAGALGQYGKAFVEHVDTISEEEKRLSIINAKQKQSFDDIGLSIFDLNDNSKLVMPQFTKTISDENALVIASNDKVAKSWNKIGIAAQNAIDIESRRNKNSKVRFGPLRSTIDELTTPN